jgi:hypothetical protein
MPGRVTRDPPDLGTVAVVGADHAIALRVGNALEPGGRMVALHVGPSDHLRPGLNGSHCGVLVVAVGVELEGRAQVDVVVLSDLALVGMVRQDVDHAVGAAQNRVRCAPADERIPASQVVELRLDRHRLVVRLVVEGVVRIVALQQRVMPIRKVRKRHPVGCAPLAHAAYSRDLRTEGSAEILHYL